MEKNYEWVQPTVNSMKLQWGAWQIFQSELLGLVFTESLN